MTLSQNQATTAAISIFLLDSVYFFSIFPIDTITQLFSSITLSLRIEKKCEEPF